MVKLIFKNKTILQKMKYVTSIFGLIKGLMFASEEKIKQGVCLVMLGKRDKKFGVSIHTLFCFHPYEILFVNSNLKVVDKRVLKPWSLGYTPKKPVKYIVESWKGTFRGINVGAKVKIIA